MGGGRPAWNLALKYQVQVLYLPTHLGSEAGAARRRPYHASILRTYRRSTTRGISLPPFSGDRPRRATAPSPIPRATARRGGAVPSLASPVFSPALLRRPVVAQCSSRCLGDKTHALTHHITPGRCLGRGAREGCPGRLP